MSWWDVGHVGGCGCGGLWWRGAVGVGVRVRCAGERACCVRGGLCCVRACGLRALGRVVPGDVVMRRPVTPRLVTRSVPPSR